MIKKLIYFFYFLWDCPSPKKSIKKYKSISWFLRDRRLYKQQLNKQPDLFPITLYHPCLLDKTDDNGGVKGHYFWQDLWVAQRVFQNNPHKHVDIGSSVKGFIAHVCIFREIESLDIRPQNSTIKNIKFIQADLMDNNFRLINYSDSVSCLHALEHFGLGRYGDPIDVNGYLKGLANITKMLISGGKLYLSVPIGKQRTEFNAHRVFAVSYLLELLKNNYIIDLFSYVDDKGDFFENAPLSEHNIASNFSCNFGCGIFELTKI